MAKMCAYCRTEIAETEASIICPSCGIPHHRKCWDENNGCATFGCSEQHYSSGEVQTESVCRSCGAVLRSDQAFCHKCGTSRSEAYEKKCTQCGNNLGIGQEFCPRCGYKASLNGQNDNIAEYNRAIANKRKKKKVVPIVLSILFVILAVVGLFAYKEIQTRRIEAERQRVIEEQRRQRDEYITNAKSFCADVINAAANVEDVVDTIQSYWYENIWEKKHGNTIDDAIEYAMEDKSTEITNAIIDKSNIDKLYEKLKTIPYGITEYKIERINIAVMELYSAYTKFYDMAVTPSGSYNSYSEDNKKVTEDILSKFEALNILLE